MHVLVVGGAGYIGSHTCLALKEAGHEVTVLDNFSNGHRDAVFADALIEADIRDEKAVAGAFTDRHFDAVIHFAALIEAGVSVPWGRMNHIMGCGVRWSDEVRAKYWDRLRLPEGRHYMMGDQISYHSSWQEGALASAEFALQDMDRRVRSADAATAGVK